MHVATVSAYQYSEILVHRSRSHMFASVILLLLCSCEGSVRGDGAVEEWPIDPTPILSVGDTPDADTIVLGSVSDARWLANGSLAVADAGSFAVLHFDATGRPGARVGRKGRGPGEFADAMTLMEMPGDSTAAWDPSQRRWTMIDSRTGGTRNASDSLRASTMLHAGLMVLSDLADPPAWVPRLLSGLSVTSAEVRMAHLDERALLWVSQDTALREWLVYADSAAPLASVSLPQDVRVLHFQRGAVVGVAADSTGLERIVVLRIRMGDLPTIDRTPAVRPVHTEDERIGLRALMRGVVTAQEMHYMKANGYTMHADSLNLDEPGTRFRIVSANNRGWRGVAWFTATGFTCGMFVGQAVPGGWGEGEPRCGW